MPPFIWNYEWKKYSYGTPVYVLFYWCFFWKVQPSVCVRLFLVLRKEAAYTCAVCLTLAFNLKTTLERPSNTLDNMESKKCIIWSKLGQNFRKLNVKTLNLRRRVTRFSTGTDSVTECASSCTFEAPYQRKPGKTRFKAMWVLEFS